MISIPVIMIVNLGFDYFASLTRKPQVQFIIQLLHLVLLCINFGYYAEFFFNLEKEFLALFMKLYVDQLNFLIYLARQTILKS